MSAPGPTFHDHPFEEECGPTCPAHITEHRTRVIPHAWDGEWLAICSCGWTGSYFRDEDKSVFEAERHRWTREVLLREPPQPD